MVFQTNVINHKINVSSDASLCKIKNDKLYPFKRITWARVWDVMEENKNTENHLLIKHSKCLITHKVWIYFLLREIDFRID